MSNITTASRPQATLEASIDPTITNISAVVANTEYSHTLTGVKQFTIRARGTSIIKYAFVAGDSGVNYITIRRGCREEFFGLTFSGTIYFQCDEAAEMVEIIEWV